MSRDQPSSSMISFSANATLVLDPWILEPVDGFWERGTLYIVVEGKGGFMARWITRMPILTVVLRCNRSSARSAKIRNVNDAYNDGIKRAQVNSRIHRLLNWADFSTERSWIYIRIQDLIFLDSKVILFLRNYPD